MFTGLIREVGTVVSREGGEDGVRLTIDAPATAVAAQLGDSIAIDGVCLTVVDTAEGEFHDGLRATRLARLMEHGAFAQDFAVSYVGLDS